MYVVENVRFRVRLSARWVNIDGGSLTGSVAGYITGGGSIRNCYVTGSVSSSGLIVGGIAGRVESTGGGISNCYSTATVSSTHAGGRVGGIAGELLGGNITNCYATRSVSGAQFVGGIIGYSSSTANQVTGCVALNQSIFRSLGTTASFGRISGSTDATFSNNAAWGDMLVMGGTITTGAQNNLNGADLTLTQAKTQSTYSGSPRSWGFAGTETSPWKWGNTDYPLPVLWFQATTTYPTLPTHLQ